MKLRFPHWAFAIGCAMMLLHPLRAHAALSGGKFLTQQESLEMFGRQITGRYYDGTQYVDTVFNYVTDDAIGELYVDSSYSGDIVARGVEGLVYSANNISVNTNPSAITFDLHPEISVLNTQQIHTVIGLSGGGSISNTVYNPPRWEWVINGLTTVYQAQGGAGPSYPQYWPSFQGYGQYYYSFVRADYTANSDISGYSLRASFYGNSVAGGNYLLFIAYPYVSNNAVGQSGTLASGSGSVTTTGTTTTTGNETDLTETNSLLGSIKQGIENLANSILNGLKNLFIPSETFMTEWKDDMSDELEDHLGGIYEATDILHDWAAQFRNVQASSEIYVPAVTVPLAGVSWTVGDWHVPLKPTGMPALVYEGFALIVDFLALAAFLNMCHKKLEVVLVPESEKVD